MTLSVGDSAPDVMFGLRDDEQVLLSHYWRDKAVVVAFLRHFG